MTEWDRISRLETDSSPSGIVLICIRATRRVGAGPVIEIRLAGNPAGLIDWQLIIGRGGEGRGGGCSGFDGN